MIFRKWIYLAVAVLCGMVFAAAVPTLVKAHSVSIRASLARPINAPNSDASPDSMRSPQAPDAPTVFYVSKSGDGSDPQAGFDTGLTSLQDAIGKMDSSGVQIWVSAGVYYPDEGALQLTGSPTATFVLTDNIAIYGGFDDKDIEFDERDWETNITVLSGDIDDNDTNEDKFGVIDDTDNIVGVNAYHVVSARGVSNTALLDGFTITAGYADGVPFYTNGGGFYCDGPGAGNQCSPTLKNITFSGNYAYGEGGGMYNNGSTEGASSPILTDVIFQFNYSESAGGGVANIGRWQGQSSPIFTRVEFKNNEAGEFGGAVFNGGYQGETNPEFRNAEFYSNTADSGGAVYNSGSQTGNSSPSFKNAVFTGNTALNGGAIGSTSRNNGKSISSLYNVTMSGNSASSKGGALYQTGDPGDPGPSINNSVLWKNTDSSGTGTISATVYNDNTIVSFTHSLVQGILPGGNWIGGNLFNGGGNIDTDPLFIQDPALPSGMEAVADLHLGFGSPAIDAGDNDFVEDIPVDLDGVNRTKDGDGDGDAVVDMGAYEAVTHYKLTVSKTGSGSGVVNSSPAGINCGSACEVTLPEGSQITLSAEADPGSTFTGWGGDCSGVGKCEVIMSADRSVTAAFEIEPGYSIYLPVEFR